MADNQIQHVNLAVGDLGAAVAFYTDVLGLGLASTPDLGFPAQFIAINDYQEIHLNEVSDVTSAAGPLLHPRRRLQRGVPADQGGGGDRHEHVRARPPAGDGRDADVRA